MSSTPWKRLLQQSLRKNDRLRNSKYFQIATVRPDGRPSNRSVVFRGFLWETDTITFVTDSRSNKVIDLTQNPWAEVAWYFPESREQYRILGKITVVTKDTVDDKLSRARVAAWKNMSDPGRQQFTWPHPGLPRATGEEDNDDTVHEMSIKKDDPVADPFCLCCICVHQVDLLNLKKNTRVIFSRKNTRDEGIDSSVNVLEMLEMIHDWDEMDVNP